MPIKTPENEDIKDTSPEAEEIEVPCFHRTQSRVRTHRGTHCGDCGKQF